MPSYQWLQLLLDATWVVFVMAFGACFGSLINVLAYRMPLGISVVSPPSRCPKCDHLLKWYDNIPVFGWLMLKGKCRYCKDPISPEYPIVEAAVALLFGVVFFAFVMLPTDFTWLGVPWGEMRPMWSRVGTANAAGIVAINLFLLGCLAGMTVVDAKTFQIPLQLPWAATAVAFVVHPLWAVWLDSRHQMGLKSLYFIPGAPQPTPPTWAWNWAIPTLGEDYHAWPVLVPFGGIAGLAVALGLMRLGLIRRSFADYEQWEEEELAKQAATQKTVAVNEQKEVSETGDSGSPGPDPDSNKTPDSDQQTDAESDAAQIDTPDFWTMYPHARREMFKELVFLTPCVLGLLAAGFLGQKYFGQPNQFPLWIQALSGVCLGYLVGGGVVWGVRIFGSLAFGKEAMGLGDVHLMAAVGACVGWIDSTVAFFVAAPVGLVWVLLSGIFGGKLSRTMPYGPYLAIATVLVMLGKPLVELGLNVLMQTHPSAPIHIP